MKVSTLDDTRIPVSRSNGQRSGLQTGGGISCRPNLAATLLIAHARYVVMSRTYVRCYRRCSWSASIFKVSSYSVSTACAIRRCARSGRTSYPEYRRIRPPLHTPTERHSLELTSRCSRSTTKSAIDNHMRKTIDSDPLSGY